MAAGGAIGVVTAGGDSTGVSTVGVVAVVVVVGVVLAVAVAVAAVVALVLTVPSPPPRTSRMPTITATTTPRVLPTMIFRFFADRAMFCLPGFDWLTIISFAFVPLRLCQIQRQSAFHITVGKTIPRKACLAMS